MPEHRLHLSATFGIRREVEPPAPLPAAAGFLVALLVAIASLAGISAPQIYAGETASWRVQGIGQDWVDLVVAVPWLLVAASALIRGSRRGALLLAGGLAYAAYSFVIYAVGVHFNQLFLVYCAIIGGSVFGLVGLALPFLRDELHLSFVAAPRRLASAFLTVSAVVFALLWLAVDVPAVIRGEPPAELAEVGLPTNPIHVLDLSLVLPALIATGVMLWRQRSAGYVLAAIALGFCALMDLNIAGITLAMRRAELGGSLGFAIGFVAIASGAAVLLVLLLRAAHDPRGARRAPKAS